MIPTLIGLEITARGWLLTDDKEWINLNLLACMKVDNTLIFAGVYDASNGEGFMPDKPTADAIRAWIAEGAYVRIERPA